MSSSVAPPPSELMPTKLTPRGAQVAWTPSSTGIIATHGPHQVAQKSSTTTWPRSAPMATVARRAVDARRARSRAPAGRARSGAAPRCCARSRRAVDGERQRQRDDRAADDAGALARGAGARRGASPAAPPARGVGARAWRPARARARDAHGAPHQHARPPARRRRRRPSGRAGCGPVSAASARSRPRDDEAAG